MSTPRKALPLREQIYNQKIKIWDLYSKSRVAETIENTEDSVFRGIYKTYNYSFNLWGGVEVVYWLRALVKKFREYNKTIEPIYVFALPNKNAGDSDKIRHLDVIARQMGLDVTIASNTKPKPPVVRKKKVA